MAGRTLPHDSPPEHHMKRASRIAVGAVVTLAMSSAATSVGTDAYAHGVHHRGSHQHRAGVEHDGSFRVLLALGRLDRRLDGAIRHQLTPLTDASGAILRSNAVADRSTVESVATRFSSAPTRRHLDAARSLLRTYHPERYVAASAILRRSGRTTAAIVGLRTLVAPGSLPAAQLSTAADLLAGIRPHRFTARTDRAEMRDVRLELGVARALVARVRSALAARS
jgi:hypothetical protein